MAHGVPRPYTDGSGKVAWVRSHIINGTTPDAVLAAYNADNDHCDRTQPVARWDWANMILTHIEYIP